MSPLLAAHIAGGVVALAAGSVAVGARKGGPLHARAGTVFAVVMLSLWASASLLDLQLGKPGPAAGNIFIAYFVVTSWRAARRRDGTAGRVEIAACALALAAAGLIAWGAYVGPAMPTPLGRGPVYVIAGACLLAGLLDLNAILRRRLTPVQRISRHLWRMCAAFFIATGSFFIGQQDVMPQALRGSPLLLALGLAPFAVMGFFLIRLRFGRRLRRAFEALGERPGASLPG